MTPAMTISIEHALVDDDDDHTYPGKADLIPEVMEATNAVLGVLVVVVLDKAEAAKRSAILATAAR